MSKLFIALLAASLVGIPLAAQSADADNNWRNSRHQSNYRNQINRGNHYGWNNQRFNQSNRFNRFGNIDNTQARLQSRLNTGLSSGRLTQSEYNRLLSQYNRIAAQEARFAASGSSLNYRERIALQNRLNALRTQLQRELNDRQRMGSRGGNWWY
jgi:hypothetical protein